jgi:hypothetical protein
MTGFGAIRQGGKDRIDHHIGVGHHLTVGEAQDAESLGFEPGRTLRVIASSGIVSVLVTIYFDSKMGTEADEIDNIRSKRDLPAKMPAFLRQALTKKHPQALLGLCLGAP